MGDKKWPEMIAVPLNEDSRSKALQADLSGWCRVLYANPMFHVWFTKHVYHFCGTNRQLSRIDPTVSNTCPSCGCIIMKTHHMWSGAHRQVAQLFTMSLTKIFRSTIFAVCLTPSITTTAQLQEEDLAWPSGKKSCWFTDNRTIICAKWPMTSICIDYFHILQINPCLCCLTSASISQYQAPPSV